MEYSQQVSVNTLQRLPTYLNYLKSLDDDGNISSTEIARALGLNDVQVRKDLSSVSSGGRPKVGYNIRGLILDLKEFLGYNAVNDAVMVGCGNLGRALMSYRGFREYGLRIVAGFDVSDDIVGEEVSGKPVLPLSGLPQYCRENGIRIGVITTPAQAAQKACDLLMEGGIKAVWNFAPAHITVGEGVLVQNENMACSLALLSKHLNEMLEEEEK
ncbi:MAG: redox-sensing transcriptional repressor Rex [Firmicutes bacterium]|mgnify:FL=1|uniref:Redox-sensing transcriptional repressor Rex n=1 Tax=Candidatus Colimorpha enterica TaxID=3083063 RepID=R6V2N8_9BACT|nr:redox-sensing transcriptional repressor Rex [Candidatus Colimorpha enterica]MCI5755797.1 redox-sensing transcriptional repressor Rex [Candidatus Colimorpha enterica]MDD6321137.1 redox-sensing transcriptional repressor Rex [Bacillota bacterium]MDY2906685.1 redox-sensing transcriptional repressor Rex [Eubacteriales bacterium]CDC77027.1 redox-sensing transcriptional repressor rex 1 [Candidatus Colimorpha enterica]